VVRLLMNFILAAVILILSSTFIVQFLLSRDNTYKDFL
jgi:hypothetical protein